MSAVKTKLYENMFQVSSTISKLSTLSDNTIRLVVDCQELNPEQAVQLFTLKGKIGWFLFKENPIQEVDLPQDKAEFRGDKTPSQRLRSCLYKFWELNTDKKIPFDDYWKKFCDKKCEEIKDKLNG